MTTQKNNFTLNLAKPLLQEINKKKFNQLPVILQNKIRNYNLDIIEIKESDNISFKPEELYKRLNHKPMPIKEHTFEFWNAYVDDDLISAIKRKFSVRIGFISVCIARKSSGFLPVLFYQKRSGLLKALLTWY